MLGNHDRSRLTNPIRRWRVGLARARAAALLLLALPGHAYVYAGDELGLEDVDIPDYGRGRIRLRSDRWCQKGHDGVRVPLPWRAEAASYGFIATRRPDRAAAVAASARGWESLGSGLPTSRSPVDADAPSRSDQGSQRNTTFGHGQGHIEVDRAGMLHLELRRCGRSPGSLLGEHGPSPGRVPTGELLSRAGPSNDPVRESYSCRTLPSG